MPATTQRQARWARMGCPGSKMGEAKCAEFVPHGPGSMKRLPESADRKRKIRRKVIGYGS